MHKIIEFTQKYYLNLIFIITFMGVFGSLYYSEVMGLPPCLLCWYQRIFLYPMFFISAAAIAFSEKVSPKILMVLSVPGMLLGLYQYGMQKFGLGSGFISCSSDNPCSAIDLEYLGFITIPFLSFVAFAVINAILIIKLREKK